MNICSDKTTKASNLIIEDDIKGKFFPMNLFENTEMLILISTD